MLISELDAPDHSTVFLRLFSHGDEEETYDIVAVSYLIEAPRECVMRKAFERGEISWQDFWYHRNWLIELTSRLSQSNAKARYVHPMDIHPDGKAYIETCDPISPLMCKYEVLRCHARWELEEQGRSGIAQQHVDNFLKEYGCYLEKQSA